MSRKLLKSAAVVSAMITVSRVLGLVRDVVFARYFGAGMGTDAFFIAFKIPNFLRRLFAEGAFSQAFIPVLTEYKTKRTLEDVRGLSAHVIGTLGVILFIITLIGVIAAPILVMAFAPGFIGDQSRLDLTADMLRITFPYILFISLTALAGGILNSYGKFGVPALTPVLLNVVMIGAAVWVSPYMDPPIMALAWGVFIAGVVQLLFQLPFLYRMKLLGVPRWGWKDEGVKRILRLMVPALFGSSVVQINLLFDVLIASFLAAGSVSWLYYSDRLVEFPLGVFGIALATVILPKLSQRHAEQSKEHFSLTLDWALRWVVIIGTPAALGLFLLSGPLITTIFHYGEFTDHAVYMAKLSLMAYSLGLMGFILVKILAPGYYARQDTKTPVKYGIIAMLTNMVLNVLFVVPMVYLSVEGPHAGLALATACSAFINAGLLYRGLRRNGVYHLHPGWLKLILRVTMASICMALVIWFGAGDLQTWLLWGLWERVMNLTLWVVAGSLMYFVVLFAIGLRSGQLVIKP